MAKSLFRGSAWYLRSEPGVWGALALHAAGAVALGLGVLPVLHGGAARTPLQLVLRLAERQHQRPEGQIQDRETGEDSRVRIETGQTDRTAESDPSGTTETGQTDRRAESGPTDRTAEPGQTDRTDRQDSRARRQDAGTRLTQGGGGFSRSHCLPRPFAYSVQDA